jgi:hypothetical protein
MRHALGITVHTGWGACVLVGGSLRKPEIIGNEVIELLEETERFCYHRAAEMKPELVAAWLERARAKALAQARRGLAALMTAHVRSSAIVAKEGTLPDPDAALATHMRIHSAEGLSIATFSATPVRFPAASSRLPHSTSRRPASWPPDPGVGTRSSQRWRHGGYSATESKPARPIAIR